MRRHALERTAVGTGDCASRRVEEARLHMRFVFDAFEVRRCSSITLRSAVSTAIVPEKRAVSISVACHRKGTLRGSMMNVRISAAPVAMTVAQNQKKIFRKRLRMIDVLCAGPRCE